MALSRIAFATGRSLGSHSLQASNLFSTCGVRPILPIAVSTKLKVDLGSKTSADAVGVDAFISLAELTGKNAAVDPLIALERDLLPFQLEMSSHKSHSKQADSDFLPTDKWQLVPKNKICPPGLQFQVDFSTGRTWARLLPEIGTSTVG